MSSHAFGKSESSYSSQGSDQVDGNHNLFYVNATRSPGGDYTQLIFRSILHLPL